MPENSNGIASNTISDFLNPNSMLTPGIAGGITMLITNAMWVNFGVQPRWTGLLISALLSFLVLTALEKTYKSSRWQQSMYFLLNTLIIFSVGAGGDTVGKGVTGTTASTQAITSDSLFGLVISTTHAQEQSSPIKAEELEEKVRQLEERLQQLERLQLEDRILLGELRRAAVRLPEVRLSPGLPDIVPYVLFPSSVESEKPKKKSRSFFGGRW